MSEVRRIYPTEGYATRRHLHKDRFAIGEKIVGRIYKSAEDNELILKLLTGEEFNVNIEGNASGIQKRLQKFKVKEFIDDRLNVELLIEDEVKNSKDEPEKLALINKLKINTKDLNLIKEMINFELKLSKESIEVTKSIIEFKEKIDTNPREIDLFIDKYLGSKNISKENPNFLEIKGKLIENFKELKNIDIKDVMLFIEEKVDLDKANIISYNKLFKEDVEILEFLKGVQEKVNTSNSKDNINPKEDKNTNIDKVNIEHEVIDYNTDDESDVKDNFVKLKDYNINSNEKNNVSTYNNKSIDVKVLELLENISIENENKVIDNNKISIEDNFETLDIAKENTIINDENKISGSLEKNFSNSDEINKEYKKEFNILKENLSKYMDIDDNEWEEIKEKIIIDIKNIDNGEEVDFKEIASRIIRYKNEKFEGNDLKKSITNQGEIVEKIIKDLSKAISENKGQGLINNFLEETINDLKMFNKISNEYYYLDFPIKRNKEEYPCKLVVKDNRKSGKKIDGENFKVVVSVKTKNIGIVDGYISISNNNMCVDLKCNERYESLISSNIDLLIENLKGLGYSINIEVSVKDDEINLSNCREFFSNNNVSSLDTRV